MNTTDMSDNDSERLVATPIGSEETEGEGATEQRAICAFVRVHDVEKNKRAIRMTRALMREHEV